MVSPAKGIKLRAGVVKFPVFFPSVSSVKAPLSPLDHVRFLNAFSATNRQYLVSAYDLVRTSDSESRDLHSELARAKSIGVVVLLDSGNYESYWRSPSKVWTQEEYHEVLREFSFDIAFGFDEQNPPEDVDEHLAILQARYLSDRTAAAGATLVPIVHGSGTALPEICARFAASNDFEMLAVPERRLGEGILERAALVARIKRSLSDSGKGVALHILGTGNPLSLAIYALAGADSFDGLEWCQITVDHQTGFLHHFSLADLFHHQTPWGAEAIPYRMRTYAHNLTFYNQWMTELRNAMSDNTGVAFCRRRFPSALFATCSSALGWAGVT